MTKSRNDGRSDDARQRTRPITEGYVVKGGQNTQPSKITVRPPAPKPMTPKAKGSSDGD